MFLFTMVHSIENEVLDFNNPVVIEIAIMADRSDYFHEQLNNLN